LQAKNVHYLPIVCQASNLLAIAQQKLQENAVEDIAYFEPFYLKGANITVPK
jgi:tRNA A37 threonylcarbamoyladenosine modification protein TsaB